MAQQIQFIYLTQNDYDNLAPQASKIYFTSDTHRIYKGSDLYAATTFDQLNFNTIEASGITVDGKPVSVEGHTHSSSEITDLDPTSFAPSSHTHPGLSGLTSSSITKETGTFTNLVVTSASIDATSITASAVQVNGGIQASTVSASAATFKSLKVNERNVSLEGHTHSTSEVDGLYSLISAATSGFASSKHTHAISEITSLSTKVNGLTSSKVEKTNGVFTNLSTTNLTVSSATFDAISIEASSMAVNGTGTFGVVSAATATFGNMEVTGTATLVAAKLNGKDVATQEYVQQMISQAIGQILASSY